MDARYGVRAGGLARRFRPDDGGRSGLGHCPEESGKTGAFDEEHVPQVPFYLFAIAWLFWGLGSFLYFTLCELFWRGQTFGKWACGVRVVKADGFSLDDPSILLRNIFRIVDQIPPLWIVPVLSPRSQRFGDMVAGTVVVSDRRDELEDVRTMVLQRPAAECRFRFDGTMLTLALPMDIEAVEAVT